MTNQQTGTGLQRSPIRWMGGKALLAKQIIGLFTPHTCYVEGCGGGGALFFNKERSKVEIYNDVNSDLVNFFRVLRYHPEALIQELKLIPNSREEFEAYLQHPGFTDIQRAARWFFLNANSFGGKGEHFAAGKRSGGGALVSQQYRLETIRKCADRFDKVVVENLDVIECLERYDSPETLFFLDPPYLAGATYKNRMSIEQHQLLAETVLGLQGNWILTYDDVPQLREWYSGCEFIEVSTAKGISNNLGKPNTARLPQLIIRGGS
ncbi:MAG: DNA adenine methylase [Cyanobacteria bacterium P01_F01_bin.56]